MRPVRPGFLKNIFPPAAPGGGPAVPDHILVEDGSDLLMEDGLSLFLIE